MRRLRGLARLAALCLLWPQLAAAQNPFASELTVEKEKEMASQIHAQIRQQYKLVMDPVLLDYLDEVGESLVKATEPQPFIFRFTLLDDPQLNAFTIGGGYVYVTTGVLEQAGDINELAGVLAHEIGHVEKRHLARQNEGQGLSTLVTLAGLAAAIAARQPGAMIAAQGLNVSLQLKHSREFEAEADRAGIEIMTKTGYDPEGMRRFFQRIIAENPREGEGIPAYLFTHPAVGERVAATKVEMERIGAPHPKREDPRLREMQSRLAQLTARDQPAVGGLHQRATFDAAKTDPLLDRARAARGAGKADEADEILAQAAKLEPGDPRVWLERADIATERGDLESARGMLEKALAIDPTVPLVQYQLGSIHARLGNKSRAAFYLEQAVSNFRVRSAARRRAEFELAMLEFKVLDRSGLASSDSTERKVFKRGEPVTWYGAISKRFYPTNPEVQVRWIAPSGATVYTEKIRMSPLGRLSSTLKTGNAAAGTWHVVVRVESSEIESQEFDIQAES
jgi:predicted Zn-dependent protease